MKFFGTDPQYTKAVRHRSQKVVRKSRPKDVRQKCQKVGANTHHAMLVAAKELNELVT